MKMHTPRRASGWKAAVSKTAALGVAAALALTACAAPAEPAGPDAEITIEFPNFQAGEAPFSVFWEAFLAAYQTKYPNVTVKHVDVQQSNAYADSLSTRFAANNPPEVIMQSTANFARFAGADLLMPLDDLLADTNVPEKWSPLQETYVWEGTTYGVLTLPSAAVLYYNEKLIKDAGQKLPTTAAELIKVAEAVYNPDAGIYGFVGAGAAGDAKSWIEASTMVYGAGGTWFEGDTNEPAFTSSKTLAGLEVYRSLMATSPRGLPQSQRNELFQAGKAAFMVEGTFFGSALKSKAAPDVAEHLKAMGQPFDVQPGSPAVFLAIPAGLEGARLEAAENFVRLALSPDWQAQYTRIVGVPGPDPDAWQEIDNPGPFVELFSELNAKAVNFIPISSAVAMDMPVVQKQLIDAFGLIATSDRPIKDIMSETADSVRQIFK